MKNKLFFALCAIVMTISVASCKKGKQDSQPSTPATLPFSLQFAVGANATPITIDSSNKVLRNLPRTCSDLTQITASAILPSGYSISPDPSTIKNYSSPVSFTIMSNQGATYNIKVTALPYDSVTNPYGIYTVKDLNDVRNGLKSSYLLMNDIRLPDVNTAGATATGISDYGTYGWYCIGTEYVNGGPVVFRGALNGGNHTISNLSSSYRPSSQPDGIDAGHTFKSNEGLFGYAATATFKNITIQLGTPGIIAVSSDGSGGSSPVGALVGRADTCTFSSCFVTGNAIIKGALNCGGLIGRANNSTINKCVVVLTHSSGNFAVSGGNPGGLIGFAYGSTISDSYASCDISGSGNMGGLIGTVNSSSVQTCYASGSVSEDPFNTSSNLTANNSLGGLVGNITANSPLSSPIKNCYATGNVAGGNGSNIQFHQGTSIGGLIGLISANSSGPITVSYCYATGSVSRVYTNSATPYLIGGLVGNTANNIFVTAGNSSTNYWDKTITTQTNLGGGNTIVAQDNAFTANGRTTAELKTQSTYVNWDFSSVWAMAAGTNNGYPYLRSINK